MFAEEREDPGGDELSHRGPGNRAVIKCSDFGTRFAVSSESDRGTRGPRKELKNRSMAKGKLTCGLRAGPLKPSTVPPTILESSIEFGATGSGQLIEKPKPYDVAEMKMHLCVTSYDHK
jgi:hypothetical protein